MHSFVFNAGAGWGERKLADAVTKAEPENHATSLRKSQKFQKSAVV